MVEGVRSDNNLVFAGPSGDVAIASTPDEHLVFWTGEAGNGLFARRVNGRGEPVGDVLEITEQGPFGPVAATTSGDPRTRHRDQRPTTGDCSAAHLRIQLQRM